MDIVIIGTGNVANILGRKLIVAGHNILQVVGRSDQKAKELGQILGVSYTCSFDKIDKHADFYLIAVSDAAIIDVGLHLTGVKGIIAHTAGSIPINVLTPFSERTGVFYPLQSLRSGMVDLPEIPLLINGSNKEVTEQLNLLGCSISDCVMDMDDDKRLVTHVAAVFVSNFTNHLYKLAEEFCDKKDIPFNLFHPLILETAKRIEKNSPGMVQTGPAIRNDIPTIKHHVEILEDQPELKNIYEFLTKSIQKHHIY